LIDRGRRFVSATFAALAFVIAPAFAGAAPKPKGLDPTVLELGLRAFERAKIAGIAKRNVLTIIDYTRPSTQKRLWVLDLDREEVLFHDLVAHGKGSGPNVPTSFSNRNLSYTSSLGVFVTLDTYEGKHGNSLKLRGLESGYNDLAESRSIVVHGADYVSDAFSKKHGRLGRSWGCPAVREEIADELIEAIAGGSIVFAYAKDRSYLAQSAYLRESTPSPLARSAATVQKAAATAGEATSPARSIPAAPGARPTSY
jgi:hypothetical protein